MLQIVKAEQLKMKHTFGNKLLIIAPILTMLIALVLTGGIAGAFSAGAWNWWYIILLPGTLAVFCYLSIKKDKKIKYYNMLTVSAPPEKSWIGKLFCCAWGLLLSNMIVFLGTLLGGAVFGTTISAWNGFLGAVLLSITYLWEIPLFLMLSARFGMFISIFVSVVLSVSGVVTLADTSFWWVYPASIPIRLMCPALGVQPNGLLVPEGSELLNPGVILPGILLSLIWFFALAVLSALWFQRLEADS